MKIRTEPWLVSLFLCLSLMATAQQGEFEKEFSKGKDDLAHENYKSAEKHLRAAVKLQPDSWEAHYSLANALFFQTKMDCTGEYEQAKQLIASSNATEQQKRQVTDQLGIVYGVTGQYAKSIEVYQKAIGDDPNYPLYPYNLACTFAEKGDLDSALTNLQEAFKKKDQWPEGRSFPDPRKDSSFKKYLSNEKFQKTVKEMGFQ